jgi:hypothetical protein
VRLIAIVLIATLAVVPSSWVLRAREGGLSVYLDSSRVERARPDTAVGIWVRWVYDSAVRGGARDAAFVKRIEVHTLIWCRQTRVRVLSLDVYDPTGALLGHHDMTATDDLLPIYDAMVHNAGGPICAWLRNPASPVVVVP